MVLLFVLLLGFAYGTQHLTQSVLPRWGATRMGWRLRWGLRRLGWVSTLVDPADGYGAREEVLVRTFPNGQVTLRRGPSGGFADGELRVEGLPAWLRVTADAKREPGVSVGDLAVPPAFVLPGDMVTRVVVALEKGGWVNGGSMAVPVGDNLLPIQVEVEAKRLADGAAGLRDLPDGRVDAVDRCWRDARYSGRAAAARWLIRHRPERRDALLAELLVCSEPELRLIAAAELPRVDVLEELVQNSTSAPLLSQAVSALRSVAPERLSPLLAARIRAQTEPWGALLEAVREAPDAAVGEALYEVVAGNTLLLEPAQTVATLAHCTAQWEQALASRVLAAPEAGLLPDVREVLAERGTEILLHAIGIRQEGPSSPLLAQQLTDLGLAIRRRLGLAQDGQMALVGGGGELAVVGTGGEVAVATEVAGVPVGEVAVAPVRARVASQGAVKARE